MGAAPDRDGPAGPVMEQPPHTPEALRAALVRLAPELLPTFDAERADALEAARSEVSAAPMRRLVGQWSLRVAIERFPHRAARLRELETRAAEVEDPAEAGAITREIGEILDAARQQAGLEGHAA
ncbi:hypothetical protein FNQ90_22145 [Streptomyces alkaliphilus]|uniref:Uncharacterized protein n=1 Tax=Streptomyces alkaliphilus TaxID=1472722 RepID=A0A7W3Y3D6_9ACTN|nr:DUF6247 family protein [Streptomyces alkaliphilus]MBB0246744.1 hypothetical protein [Streptomyces alkaliphilus]